MNLQKKVEDIFDLAAEPAVSIVSSMFLEGIVGSVVPGVASAVLSYKQKRSERMVEAFMLETKRRQSELEEKLFRLEEQNVKEITGKYFGLVLDYVTETKQEEKISYIVNGFINLTSMDKLQEDIILLYYNLLEELTLLELRVLKTFEYSTGETYEKICEEASISQDQFNVLESKLDRLKLIETEEQSQYSNLVEAVCAIRDHITGRPTTSPNWDLGMDVWANSSYFLTKIGREFLNFFTDESSKKI